MHAASTSCSCDRVGVGVEQADGHGRRLDSPRPRRRPASACSRRSSATRILGRRRRSARRPRRCAARGTGACGGCEQQVEAVLLDACLAAEAEQVAEALRSSRRPRRSAPPFQDDVGGERRPVHDPADGGRGITRPRRGPPRRPAPRRRGDRRGRGHLADVQPPHRRSPSTTSVNVPPTSTPRNQVTPACPRVAAASPRRRRRRQRRAPRRSRRSRPR